MPHIKQGSHPLSKTVYIEVGPFGTPKGSSSMRQTRAIFLPNYACAPTKKYILHQDRVIHGLGGLRHSWFRYTLDKTLRFQILQ